MVHGWSGLWVVHALGWTLLHFCWQGALVAVLLWCVLGILRAHRSQLRYGVACCGLALMVALPVATFVHVAPAARLAAMQQTMLRLDMDLDVTVMADGSATVTEPLKDQVKDALNAAAPWVPAVWLAGVVLFLMRLSLGLAAASRMKTNGTERPPLELQQQFERLRVLLGVRHAARLLHSAVVQVPTVIGWLRPVVLIPVSCLTGLTDAQIEAILCHELAHIRRHDYLVSVFQSVVEALLFYHPAVWWVSRQIRRERECCCDDLAVAVGGDVLAYARALSYLEERRSLSPAIVLGANGGVLKMRIRRLLGSNDGAAASQLPAILLVAMMVAGACIGIARAEPKVNVDVVKRLLGLRTTEPVSTEAMLAPPELLPMEAGPKGFVVGAAGVAMLENGDSVPQAGSGTAAGDRPDMSCTYYDNQSKEHSGSCEEQDSDTAKYFCKASDTSQIQEQASCEWKVKRLQDWENQSGVGAPQKQELHGVYKTWLEQDVRWIITPQEEEAFRKLQNTQERDTFIDQFWQRRNPIPGSADNSYRNQIYQRIQYANDHFAAGKPGWETDRGHVYIVYGKPDDVAIQPNGPGGHPSQSWHYNYIPGVGNNVWMTFADTGGTGDYHYTVDGPNGSAQDATPPPSPNPLKRRLSDRGVVATGNAAAVLAPPPVHAAQAQGDGAVEGTVVDPSGALVRGAKVTATNTDTGIQTIRTTDDAGKYSLPVHSGPYNVEVQAKGFQRLLQENVNVHPGENVGLNLKLSVGGASETITVTGKQSAGGPRPVAPPPAAKGAPAQKGPLTVSPATGTGMLAYKADPVYPEIAKAAHVQGVVVLRAIISKTGKVEDARVVSGRPMLTSSALDAVKQWRYKPYLVNGKPVAVETTINVNYSLGTQGNTSFRSDTDAPKPPNPDKPARISSGVAAGLAISQPSPVYPPEAKAAHIQGTVVLQATISKTGDIEDLWVVSGPKELVQSAIDAVTQWRYKPYLLNGEPVEVTTRINVNYAMDSSDTSCTYCPAGPAAILPVRILRTLSTTATSLPGGTIRTIDYKELHSVTISDVDARLRSAGIDLRPETPYDPGQIARAVTVMKRLLAEHNHPKATVYVSFKQLSPGAIGIQFNIKEGPKGTAGKRSNTQGSDAAAGNTAQTPEVAKKIGGDVSAPVLVYRVDPEFTEQARKAKASGVVVVGLNVDAQGLPEDVRVLRGFGTGPDGRPDPKQKKNVLKVADGMNQNAVAAVGKYRFKPATENGSPVMVALNVEVNFQVF